MIKEINAGSGQSLPQNTYTRSVDIIRKGYLLEEWRTIKYYHLDGTLETFDNYEVNRNGLVRRKDSRYIKYPELNGNTRYPTVGIKTNTGESVCRKIHVILASTFIGPRFPQYHIDHINRDPKDYRLENLRYLSRSDNAKNIDERSEAIKIFEKYDPKDNSTVIYDQRVMAEEDWDYIVMTSGYRNKKNIRWRSFTIDTFNFIQNKKINLDDLSWKEIPELENTKFKYFVSEVGIILRKGNLKEFYTIGTPTDDGYRRLVIKLKRKGFSIAVHILVARFFLNNGVKFNQDQKIDHIDTNRENNIVSNLKICQNNKENMANIITRMKLSTPIKCHDNINGGWLYFSGINLAAKVLETPEKSIKYRIKNGDICKIALRSDVSCFEYWSEEDYELFGNGEIKIIDTITDEIKFIFKERRIYGRPIKVKYSNDSNWIYFLSYQDLCKDVGIKQINGIKHWKQGDRKCSKGYIIFEDWDKNDWNMFWNNKLTITR